MWALGFVPCPPSPPFIFFYSVDPLSLSCALCLYSCLPAPPSRAPPSSPLPPPPHVGVTSFLGIRRSPGAFLIYSLSSEFVGGVQGRGDGVRWRECAHISSCLGVVAVASVFRVRRGVTFVYDMYVCGCGYKDVYIYIYMWRRGGCGGSGSRTKTHPHKCLALSLTSSHASTPPPPPPVLPRTQARLFSALAYFVPSPQPLSPLPSHLATNTSREESCS